MKLIVGLGNPGEKYLNSRHNLGFMILERFLEDIEPTNKPDWQTESRFSCMLAVCDWVRKDGTAEKLYLVLPTTFMNESGTAVQQVSHYYKIDSSDVWVVNDELDLPLGSMKIRYGGAAAGHHGVEDIMEKLGTDKFWRFRMGIGESRQHVERGEDENDGHKQTLAKMKIHDASDFVLGDFNETEKTELKHLLKMGSDALKVALEKGIETAQNQFNTK